MHEVLEQFEEEEKEVEEAAPEFTQKEIGEMKTISSIDDVRKGDFAKINGEFREVERIEWMGTEGFVVTVGVEGEERYKAKLVRIYKKNPTRP